MTNLEFTVALMLIATVVCAAIVFGLLLYRRIYNDALLTERIRIDMNKAVAIELERLQQICSTYERREKNGLPPEPNFTARLRQSVQNIERIIREV